MQIFYLFAIIEVIRGDGVAKVILHCDVNNCYAQIEEMMFPELRNVPLVVGGSEEDRHGIVLAKNYKAKAFGIQTGEPLVSARKKCPGLVTKPANMKMYMYYANKVKDIYREYTDLVESFGVDEAWCDMTASQRLFGDGYTIAKRIQDQVLEELGLTISIGVSFNKIFAKLGSDMIKPSGLVVITEENFKAKVWPLPVSDLLMVGRSTTEKLRLMHIKTIGDLANASLSYIVKYLGKNGAMIWSFANGMDESTVKHQSFKEKPKSIGNSTTTKKDMQNFSQASIVLQALADSVASRLKDQHLQGRVVSLSLRDTKLVSFTRQLKLSTSTYSSYDLYQIAQELLLKSYDFRKPLRSIGISVSDLVEIPKYQQLDLFSQYKHIEDERLIEEAMETIRHRFGFYSVMTANRLLDTDFGLINPKGDHTVHPIGFKVT